MTTFALKNRSMEPQSFQILTRALARRLAERGCALTDSDSADYTLTLAVDETLTADRFRIQPDGAWIACTAANSCALHAAVGYYLMQSRFDGNGGFAPYEKAVDFTPAKPLRGMYFATHFHNYYEEAPIAEVYEVIEDLALRGCNALLVWYDMHQFASVDDPKSQVLIERLKAFMRYAKEIGMKASMMALANEGFDTSPVPLRASFRVENGYHTQPCGIYNREICPSKPGGMAEILRERRAVLEAFAETAPDYICYWPYDQGGCTCASCAPWGSNGFLRILPKFRQLVQEVMPGTRLILSTWYFDHFVDGEWDAFWNKLLAGEISGFDYIMSFFHGGVLPDCIKRDGIPKRIKFIEFPEISMQECSPWGGFGANPLCRSIDRTNMASGHLYEGGYPYSEGIFEDVNKYILLSYYSGASLISHDAVTQYARFEFCCDNTDLVDAIERTQTGLERGGNDSHPWQFYIRNTSDIEYVYDVFTAYNRTLPENIRKTNRWQMLYLRAVIDHELLHNNGIPTRSERCEHAIRELYRIYHATPETNEWVRPPVESLGE